MYTSAIALATALFASAGQAAPAIRQAAAPEFVLFVNSTSEQPGRYFNAKVDAAHTGAAEEALVILPTQSDTAFTESRVNSGNGFSPFYILYQETPENKQSAQFYNNGTGNEDFLFFGIGQTAAEFVVDSVTGQLGIYVNETSSQYVFHVCTQETLGYTYDTVTWIKDFAKPTDPKCSEVFLYQKFENCGKDVHRGSDDGRGSALSIECGRGSRASE